jgi:formamidopyrimidine-DNA glycosylase
VLRTAQPPVAEVHGHEVRELRRIGKRVAIGLDNDLWIVIHLMIVHDAAIKSNASATLTTKRTTAHAARRAASCSRTAPRLLGADWPRTLDELQALRKQ